MNIVFLLADTTPNDEFRYVQNLINCITEPDINMSVVFVEGGAPADLCYQLLKNNVVNKLSFKSGRDNLMKTIGNYIDNHEVNVVVTSRATFGKHKLADALKASKSEPKIIFVGHECSTVVMEQANMLAPFKPTYVAVSCLVAERFMQGLDPLVIYGAAVMPQSSGTDIRKHYGIPENVKLLGYIGNLDLINTDMVVEATKRMGAALFVCGTGQKLSALSEIKGPIKVMPIMPEARADWYRAFSCFIYPVKGAGFPSLPVEAILCGTPVAMTPVGDMYTLFKNNIGFCGMQTAELVQAIERAMSLDWKATAEMVEKEFSVDRFVSGWYSVLS